MYATTIKFQFPYFAAHPEISYLDNAATVHKPQAVIDEIIDSLTIWHAPLRRGIYRASEEATVRYEHVRTQIAELFNVVPRNVIFTSGTTGSINLVAQGYAQHMLKQGDIVIGSLLEHHANFLPWQRVTQITGAEYKLIDVVNFDLDYDAYTQALTDKVKLVALTGLSNSVGTLIDCSAVIKEAHARGIPVLIDAAQMMSYHLEELASLNADFITFSAHKIGGPSGVGVLIARDTVLSGLKPVVLGGGMVHEVALGGSSFLQAPHIFEAGSLNLEGVLGLGAALNFELSLDRAELNRLRRSMIQQLIDGLISLGAVIHGNREHLIQHSHLVNFTMPGWHAHDISAFLDQHNIAVRAGNHCAQPLATRLGVESTVRASIFWYTTPDDIQRLLDVLSQL